jgi:RHS repeat-associated protein
MDIKIFYRKEKENLFLQCPMSDVQSPESVFCPMSNVYCLMSDFSDYMHFRYYASTMGRFLKPDNIIPNPANPQSWNLYNYVNGNPVNFNDPSGHACPASIGTSPALYMERSSANWINWGALTGFYSNLYGGNVAFAGGVSGSGNTGSTSSGSNTMSSQDIWNVLVLLGFSPAFASSMSGGHYATYASSDSQDEMIIKSYWVQDRPISTGYGGGGIDYSEMRAQPMPQYSMRAMPPSRFHFGHFLYLNAICVPNTMVWTCFGSAVGFKSGGPYCGAVGAVGGFAFSEFQYILLSIYPEGWIPPKEPPEPPPGLGSFTLEPIEPPPPSWKK